MKRCTVKKRSGTLIILALALLNAAGLCSSAYAADTTAAKDQWKLEVAPYAWLAGVSGDVTAKGMPAHIDESFSDIAKVLDFGGMLHVESGRDRVAILFDTAYIKLSDSGTFAKVHMTESITELGGAYRLLGVERGPGLALEALGGGRYWYIRSEVSMFGTIDNVGRQDWIDPFVGARLKWGLTKNLMVVVRGDVGGFNLGSKSSWNVVGTIAYSFTDSFGVGAGYRALNAHYENGDLFSKFEYNATMAGPVIGAVFSF